MYHKIISFSKKREGIIAEYRMSGNLYLISQKPFPAGIEAVVLNTFAINIQDLGHRGFDSYISGYIVGVPLDIDEARQNEMIQFLNSVLSNI
jgi:hypothetical protein